MSPSSKTALVILNYNGRNYLERFLPSVLLYTPYEVDIIVGDNASTDDSIQFIKNKFPTVKIISLATNFGFAEGYNQVLKQVEADYYFLLNSDVELKESWQPLIDCLDTEKLVAAVQPKILSHSNPAYFEHAGAAGGWIDNWGYPFCAGRILDTIEKDKGQYDQSGEIFWASGASMMVRSKVFHDLGGFDGDYFAHMEEIDWCWRAKKCGWKVMALPIVKVYHIGGGTLAYNTPRKVFLNFRNNLATIIKNESILKLLYLIPLRKMVDFTAAIQFLIKGNAASAKAIFQAYFNIYQWLPVLIKKRKLIHQLSKGKSFDKSGIFRGSLIINYFILGKRKFSQLKNE
ncbi:MAG: glycosyltransferase family 2 protein [Saprospiraceae bacterium]